MYTITNFHVNFLVKVLKEFAKKTFFLLFYLKNFIDT